MHTPYVMETKDMGVRGKREGREGKEGREGREGVEDGGGGWGKERERVGRKEKR